MLKLSVPPSDCIFYLYIYIHEFTGSPFIGSFIRKVWLLIRFLIFFKVAFSQDFLTSSGNLVTSEKLLGYDMKWETSEINYYKDGNELFISFTTFLKTLCEPLPILFSGISSPFYSLCAFLIWSHILNIGSVTLIFGCTCFPYWMSYILFELIDAS